MNAATILGDERGAVVTGQQAGLFGGPLYTLYKLLGAIAIAGARDTRAVFWVECDDADVREVDRASVVDADGELRTVALGLPADGRPVADRPVPDAVGATLDELASWLPTGEPATAALADLRATWSPGRPWQTAFAAYLERLVAPHPVAFLDSSAQEVKRAATPLFARVVAQADEVLDALAEGAAAVGTPQVPVRPDELPLFVLDQDGVRRRLLRHGKEFTLRGGDHRLSPDEVRRVIEEQPDRISASALLRPVVQDRLLRTTVYVAGPAERRYHAQLGPLYRLLEVAPPELVDRPRFTLVEPRAARAARKLGVDVIELADRGAAAVAAAARATGADPQAETARIAGEVADQVGRLVDDLGPAVAKQLERAADEATRKIEYQLERLGKRAADTILRGDADRQQALSRALALLHPADAPQERALCCAHVLAREEAASLVARLLAAIDPSAPGTHSTLEVPAR